MRRTQRHDRAETVSKYKDYWSSEPAEVYQALGSSDRGLSEQESQRRLKIYGYNALPRKPISWVQVLIRQLKNPISVILVVASIVSGFLAELEQAVIILSMIALSVILGFFNEYRAEKIVEKLQQNVSFKAVAIRDGKPTEIESSLLVLGDIVHVYVGDIVPADIRILESKDLQVNEAALTGESFPVEKNFDRLNLQHPTPQQLTNYLFMSTVVVHGSGRGIVVSTGRNTEFGSISKSLARVHPETEFQKGVKQYGKMLFTLTLALAIGIFALNMLVGHPLIDSLLFSLAIAVGLVPELMPAIVTISLSQGARNMAKARVIVKRLVSIEDFGNMDVLCTDKTGTLTEGKIILNDYRLIDGGKDPKVLSYSLLCNAAAVGDKITGNPMDAAIWEYAIGSGLREEVNAYTKLDEIPFDYQRRIMSTVVRRNGEEIVFISKGAPESILPRSKYVEIKGRNEPVDTVSKSVNARFQDLSQQGYRLLAVAYKNIYQKTAYSVEDEKDLTLLGLLVFTDPPKKDANEAITRLKETGVDVKILTGDNELVAKKICDDIKIPVKRVVCGSDLTRMSSAELRKVVEESTIFARVTPEQKLDVIKALKSNGHVVGYMGDGVNDAPALYEADVGISVDTATDVSKDAADVVLLEKDLHVLVNGIKEGRKTSGNTIKYILMGTSSNFGNMFSAAAASVFLPFLPMLPMQILFMNLLYDVSNMTLPTDNVDDEYVSQPRSLDIGFVRKFTLFFGPFSSLYDFLTYGIMLFIFGASPALFQSGWFVESFWTEVLVIYVIRTRRIPFITSRPGKWLTILTLACIAIGTVIPFSFLGKFLGFTALPPEYWVLLALMVATYLFLVDSGKIFFYRICKF
ncbi:MAG: magnesium-translocating P-type ATPase [Thaumarchaeota archaeon]|nr:magnesium-translocating P-type ATPase [Nitrososphaerota archaeon]MCL5319150.1 magnesium-translocating P-type ATPase [Nitrososphaerota archaeon]